MHFRLITENIACFKPIEIFPKWRSILYYMRKSLRELLTEDGAMRYEAQSHQEKYSEWHRLARSLALQLSPGEGAAGCSCLDFSLLISEALRECFTAVVALGRESL